MFTIVLYGGCTNRFAGVQLSLWYYSFFHVNLRLRLNTGLEECMPGQKRLQVNVTRRKSGLNYTIGRLPDDEPLVVTMKYEQGEGSRWFLQQIVTTGAIVMERNPVDPGTVSLIKVERCVTTHMAAG